MLDMAIYKDLLKKDGRKIIMMVFDGLGGCIHPDYGATELQAAKIPVMDKMAAMGAQGLVNHVAAGMAPGSGPGHFSLFGYDPINTDVGRGVLESLGVGFDLGPDDLAARANFATHEDNGLLSDRRGERPAQERTNYLCKLLEDKIKIKGYQIFVLPGRSHRFVPVIRGKDLSDRLTETDPQVTGVRIPDVKPMDDRAAHAADIANEFIVQARKALKDETPQNDLLLRGWGMLPVPAIESYEQRYGLRAAAVATYPMYRGIARLVGMDILKTGKTFAEEVETVRKNWDRYDFFYVHRKETDSAGHAGDFRAKVMELEACDPFIQKLADLGPGVMVITGDHATPTAIKDHSFHEVPALFSGDLVIPDRTKAFDEVQAGSGLIGHIHGTEIMPLLLAFAGRLLKFKS